MKKRFLNYIKIKIKNKYPKYNDSKIAEIMYGIEGIYLTFTKTLIIFILALILKIYKELFFLLIAFNFIRLFAFGVHAEKSKDCLISSTSIFILASYLCKYIIISNYTLVYLYFLSFIIILIYSPADTKKRPLINKNKRLKFKILSCLVIIIYFVISMLINNILIKNCLIIGVLIECILVLPITYKIFRVPYKNYVNYGLNI